METSSEVNLLDLLRDLPLHLWKHLLDFFSSNELIILSSVCKELQQKVQLFKTYLDLSVGVGCNRPFNTNYLLNYTLSTTCKSINLNHCIWLHSRTLLEIISKTNLEHLHIIECNVQENCIEAICDLRLKSLSFTFCYLWKKYFLKHKNRILPCFETLKNLEIFCAISTTRHSSGDGSYYTMIYMTYRQIILQCKELEHLKIFDYPTKGRKYNYVTYSEANYFLSITPLPKLKSLIINIDNQGVASDAIHFLKLILKHKNIPLKHVDFGCLTGKLLKSGILKDTQILIKRSTFSLSDNDSDFRFWTYFDGLRKLICQPKYKKIIIESVALPGINEFVQKLIVESKYDLKEIHFKNCRLVDDYHPELLDCLSLIAINCSQITVFEVSGQLWNETDIGYDKIQRNEAVLDALTNLKNLRKLILSPQVLHSQYINENGEQCSKAMPLWKVTKSCRFLIEIRFVDQPNHALLQQLNQPTIHQDSLYDLAYSNNIEMLHLVNFKIHGDNFDLSKITKACNRLLELFIFKLSANIDYSALELSLTYLKKVKILCIDLDPPNIVLTNTFIKNLGQCEYLEKLYLKRISIQENFCEHFVESLQKLRNLQALCIDAEKEINYLWFADWQGDKSEFLTVLVAQSGLSKICTGGNYTSCHVDIMQYSMHYLFYNGELILRD